MSDDWRLRVDLHQEGLAHLFTARLESRELTHDLETSFHDRVVVSTDGPEMFCYAGTREQAERARELIRRVADEHKWEVDFELQRWHPIAEEWRDPDEALPADAAQRAEEHEELVEDERLESAMQGHPNYEVRVQSESHHDIVKLAERLESEGIPVVLKGEGEGPYRMGPVHLLVPEEFEVQARLILQEIREGALRVGENEDLTSETDWDQAETGPD
jgi:hypothetical protein